MKAYVINLSDRADRWHSVMTQKAFLGFEVVRVEAVTKESIPESIGKYVASGVAATWESHKLAMREFLKSSDEFGIILEDDFKLTTRWKRFDWKFLESLTPDFYQLGYLITSPLDRGYFIIFEFWDISLKVLVRLTKYLHIGFFGVGHRRLVQEQANMPWGLVPNNIRAGGQCYIVSRKFAAAAQEMNTPAFNTTDGFFSSLGDVRTFKMYRSRYNYVKQSDSPSSVHQRFL